MRIVLVLLCVGAAASAFAYDGSGGRVTEQLIERVQFQDTSSRFEPSPLEWNEATKATFRARFREILRQMPLDVARLQLSDLRHIDVSNSWYTVPAKVFPKIERKYNSGDDFPPEAVLGSQVDNHRELRLTGDDYLDTYLDGSVAGDEFPFTVLHELTHVWELGHHKGTYRPKKTQSFYALRFDRLKAAWTQAQEAANRPWMDLNARLQKEFADDQEFPLEMRRWKSHNDFDNERTARIKPLGDLAKRQIEAARKRLVIPTRFGGDTNRKLTNPWFRPIPDDHAMDAATEYLACLVELLWKDPAWAATQYTPEEIAWVRHNVFEDRPITPWMPPEARSRIDLPAKSAALGQSMNRIADSLSGRSK